MMKMVAHFLLRKLISLALDRGVAIVTNRWTREVERISFSWRNTLLVIDLKDITTRSSSGHSVYSLWSGEVREFESTWCEEQEHSQVSKGGKHNDSEPN